MNLDEYRAAMQEAIDAPKDIRDIPGVPTDPVEFYCYIKDVERRTAELFTESEMDVIKESGRRFATQMLDGTYHD